MKTIINDYFEKLKNTLDNISRSEIENFINILLQAGENDRTVFIMGNGGSAMNASHFVCDIAKGVSNGLKVICLNDNVAIMTAYANDVSYEDIFIGQLKNQLAENDIVIAFSGSGNSKNILKAIDFANTNGAITVGFTGYDGGLLKKTAQHSLNANICDMQISEDIQQIIIHLALKILNS